MCNWCRVLSNRGTTPLDRASLIAPPHCDSSSRNCVRDTDRPTVAGPSYWVTEKLTVHESKAESLVHVDLAWPWDTDTCSYHKSFIRCKCTSTYDFCCGPIIRGKLAIMREHFAWFPGAFQQSLPLSPASCSTIFYGQVGKVPTYVRRTKWAEIIYPNSNWQYCSLNS